MWIWPDCILGEWKQSFAAVQWSDSFDGTFFKLVISAWTLSSNLIPVWRPMGEISVCVLFILWQLRQNIHTCWILLNREGRTQWIINYEELRRKKWIFLTNCCKPLRQNNGTGEKPVFYHLFMTLQLPICAMVFSLFRREFCQEEVFYNLMIHLHLYSKMEN